MQETFSWFYWNSKWPPRINFNFLGAQKLKKVVWSIFLKFQQHIPSSMGMCKWFLEAATKIHNGRHRSTPIFFVGAKTLKLNVRNYSNSTIIFPTIWRCADDFLRFCWNSKWPPQINFNFFVGAKTQKLKSEIIHLQSHYPPSWNVQVILLKFEMAITSRLFKYLWPQKLLERKKS